MRPLCSTTLMAVLLSACASTEAPTPVSAAQFQWAEQPRDDGWRALPSSALRAEGETLWFKVELPAITEQDAAVQVRALFAEDAWVCGRHFELEGRLPILPVPCSPAPLLVRATADARLRAPIVIVGSEQQLWMRVLQQELAPFVVGATMALVGLLFLMAGLRSGAERSYRGLGLFLASLGVLTLLNTLLRHVLHVSGTAMFYAHEVVTSLYPIGFADFLLGTFGDGPWRVLRRGLRLFGVYLAIAWALHFTGVLHFDTGRHLTVAFIAVFVAQGLVLAARARKTDPSANLFLAGLAALFVIAVPDMLDGAGFKVLPFQTVPYAVLSFGVAMVLLIERQHRRAREAALASATELAARLAALEERNREINSLNAELRHQIAERSREIADALQGGKAAVRAARELDPGDVVDGRYRVTRALGRGAMGSVQAVERLSDGRRFALKMMTGEVDAPAAARFAREAEIAARVSDEHLVKVVDVGGAGSGQLYLVMEYVDGRPLEDHRARFGDVPWALGLLAQVAAGVRALHAAGVVHRDLKPGNVLLTTSADGRELAKISDFGISRRGAEPHRTTPPSATQPAPRLDAMASQLTLPSLPLVTQPLELDATLAPSASQPGSPSFPIATQPALGLDATLAPSGSQPALTDSAPAPALTVAGALLGTPAYMAPELAGGAQQSSPASDVFALGLIAYELLSGRSAFEHPPLFIALAHRHLPRVAPLPPAVPQAVADVVSRSLAEAPDARPSASAFADALGSAANAR